MNYVQPGSVNAPTWSYTYTQVFGQSGVVAGTANYTVSAVFTVSVEAIGLLANTLTFLNTTAGYLNIAKIA